MATNKDKQVEHLDHDDERFGKARNETPPDPLRESQNLAEELPREVGSSGALPDDDENAVDADVRIAGGGDEPLPDRTNIKARTTPKPGKRIAKRR